MTTNSTKTKITTCSNNPTELDALKLQLGQLSARLQELEKKETKQEAEVMLPSAGAWYIDTTGFSAYSSGYCGEATKEDQNLFPDEATAKAYGDAFSVMLALRRCKGSGRANTGCMETGFYYDACIEGIDSSSIFISPETFSVCPPFPTEEAAREAVRFVGEDRIAAAIKLLANVKD